MIFLPVYLNTIASRYGNNLNELTTEVRSFKMEYSTS